MVMWPSRPCLRGCARYSKPENARPQGTRNPKTRGQKAFPGFEFRVSGFEFQGFGFGGFGSWGSGFGSQVSGLRCSKIVGQRGRRAMWPSRPCLRGCARSHVFGFWVPSFEFRGSGLQVPGFGSRGFGFRGFGSLGPGLGFQVSGAARLLGSGARGQCGVSGRVLVAAQGCEPRGCKKNS